MINYVEGSILNAKETIIGHQVNCIGHMNTGVAKQLREAYPGLFESYENFVIRIGKDHVLGKCHFVPVNGKIIANLFGQLTYGYDGAKYTNYIALKNALIFLKEFAMLHNFTIALPYGIGCGKGGGDWDLVRFTLHEIFYDLNNLTIYKWEEAK
jgi:O-acetyl-ADP-ribose deacetylase (regulator of RNase III)